MTRFEEGSERSPVFVAPASRRLQILFSNAQTAGRMPALQRYGLALHQHIMKTETFIRRSRIDAPAAEVYAWHALPGALERLTPPGEHVEVIEKAGGIERGGRVVLQFGRWPFRRRWVAVHQDFEAGRYFSDVQVSGPFAYWKHTHTFEPDGPSAAFSKTAWNMLFRSALSGVGLRGGTCVESLPSYLIIATKLRRARCSGTGFSLWGLVLARMNLHMLKPVPQGSIGFLRDDVDIHRWGVAQEAVDGGHVQIFPPPFDRGSAEDDLRHMLLANELRCGG